MSLVLRMMPVGLALSFGLTTQLALAQDCDWPKQIGEQTKTVIQLHVKPDGSQCASGRRNEPLSSFQSAQEAVRQLLKQGKNQQGINVIFHPGVYLMEKGIAFEQQDSGKQQAKIRYHGLKGAKFVGGIELDPSQSKPLTDGRFKQGLISQQAASAIVEYDLSHLPDSALGQLSVHGWTMEPNSRVAPAALYAGGQRMTLARWPNKGSNSEFLAQKAKSKGVTGMVSYQKVIDVGPTGKGINRLTDRRFNSEGGTFSVAFDRFKYWSEPSSVYLDGILGKSWEWTYNKIESVDVDKRHITLSRGEVSGIAANKGSYFYFDNVPEELDAPGEYYIDRDSKRLYFYPTKASQQAKLQLSVLQEPALSVKGASNLIFSQLHFVAGRSDAINIRFSQYIDIEDCVIRGFSGAGVDLFGRFNTVTGCDIENVGGVGIKVNGGTYAQVYRGKGSKQPNRLKQPVQLVSGDNIVQFNRITDFAWEQKSQVPGIYLTGVGNQAIFNEISNGPHFAVLMRNSTQNTAAYNYIHDLPKYHKDDGGAFYVGSGQSPHMRGNVIQNNWFDNIPTNGVYIDNFASGVVVMQNLFTNVGNIHFTYGGVNINGGGRNAVVNNLFIDAKRPVKNNDFAVKTLFPQYYSKIKGVQDAFLEIGVENTPYKKFPDFVEFLSFKDKKQIHYQRNNVKDNLSLFLTEKADSKAALSGVVEPNDRRWKVTGNRVGDSHKSESLNQALTSLKQAPSGEWQLPLKQLTDSLADMQTSHLTYFPEIEAKSIAQQLVVGENMLNNGDFESGNKHWRNEGARLDIVYDKTLKSNVAKLSQRKKHFHSSKQVIKGLEPEQTYVVKGRLMSPSGSKIGLAMSFDAGKTDNSGKAKDTFINIGTLQKSEGKWLSVDAKVTMPVSFNPNRPVKIWIKSQGGEPETLFGDDILLAPLVEANSLNSNLIQNGDFESGNKHWRNEGAKLDVVYDATLKSNVAKLSGRKKHFHSSKQVIQGLVPEQTYLVKGQLMTPGDTKIGLAMSFDGGKTDSSGKAKDTYINLGKLRQSKGKWLSVNTKVTMPAEFNPNKPVKIWIKSYGEQPSVLYGDNIFLAKSR